jgi:YaiO family outer membrane protein
MMYVDFPLQTVECVPQQSQDLMGEAALASANAARLTGDIAAAECMLEALLSVEPQNADAWVQLGLVRAASGDTAGSREAFQHALEIAPDYDDAKFGLAQLAYRSGDLAGARAWLQLIAPVRRHDPEIAAFAESLAASPVGRGVWRVDGFAAYSSLSDGLAPWREASLAVTRREGRDSVGIAVERATRFDSSDLYGELRAARAISGATWAIALGGASHPQFRPEALARVEFETREDAKWSFGGALTIARYGVGEINRLGLRATHMLRDDVRASVQAVVVRDEADALRTGYGIAAAWRVHERVELSAIWSDAPESSEGATVDVRSLGFGIAFDIASDLRVRVGGSREERDAFDRSELSIAVTRVF